MMTFDSQAQDQRATEAVRDVMMLCLAELDRLGLFMAGAHLDMAINSLESFRPALATLNRTYGII